MPICLVEIYLLKLTGRGQQNICIASSFSYEKFMDDSKQVFADQPGSNLSSIRRGGGRVSVVNIERVHRRISLTCKNSSQAIHIQCSRSRWADRLISMGNRRFIPLQPVTGAIHKATTWKTILASQGWQTSQGAYGLTTIGMTIYAIGNT